MLVGLLLRRAMLVGLLLALLGLALSEAVAPTADPTLPRWRGVDVHSLWPGTSRAQVAAELRLASRAGSTVVRVDVTWGSLVPVRGELDRDYIASIDHFMRLARRHRMKVIATLVSSPCWASSAPRRLKAGCRGRWWDRGVGRYPPVRARDYGFAVRALIRRFGNDLAALEIWNEPNLDDAAPPLISSDPARDYMRLVRAAYPAAKRENPAVPVIAGALAFADTEFLRRLYALGLRRYQDGISVHPYNEWRSPRDPWLPAYRKYTFEPGLRAVHDAMRAAGDRGSVWITEFGWTTARGVRWGVTERQQAQYVGEAFDILTGMPWVEAACVYNLRNKGEDPTDGESNFGLVTRDLHPKPAYDALKRALTSPVRAAHR